MSNEDFKQGFKEGFAAGLEEGKKIADKSFADGYAEALKKTIPPPYVPPYNTSLYVKETCPKCGMKISGVMGYVCSSPNCPTFLQVSSGLPMTAIATTGQLSIAKDPSNTTWLKD